MKKNQNDMAKRKRTPGSRIKSGMTRGVNINTHILSQEYPEISKGTACHPAVPLLC